MQLYSSRRYTEVFAVAQERESGIPYTCATSVHYYKKKYDFPKTKRDTVGIFSHPCIWHIVQSYRKRTDIRSNCGEFFPYVCLYNVTIVTYKNVCKWNLHWHTVRTQNIPGKLLHHHHHRTYLSGCSLEKGGMHDVIVFNTGTKFHHFCCTRVSVRICCLENFDKCCALHFYVERHVYVHTHTHTHTRMNINRYDCGDNSNIRRLAQQHQ